VNRRPSLAVALAAGAAASVLLFPSPPAMSSVAAPRAEVLADSTLPDAAAVRRGWGLSGALRVAVVQALDPVGLPFVAVEEAGYDTQYRWVPMFGTRPEAVVGERAFQGAFRAPSQPGVWQLLLSRGERAEPIDDLAVITKVPFSHKNGRYLNGYHIGIYPTENSGRTDRYAPPAGFIEVTRENQDFKVSEHFRLRHFLTKDQFDVWPKYLALDLRLIDKLELVIQELNAMGVRAERMHVMSGFRTPQYNGPGGNGRAQLSRHTFGDAADVWIDNEGDGYISDLNGDGQRDVRDIEVMLRAVERVEQRYPELVGGTGVYNANGSRRPFPHIDVRGTRSRW
jgi:hypothetical protein